MKNTVLRGAFAFVAIIALTTVTGCKKGENDPALSLKSRKARISGEWKLTQGTITESETNGSSTQTDVTTYTESTCSSNGFTTSYSETLTIEKDGTYESVIVDNGNTTTIKGNWYFSGKNKEADLKKKEAIIFNETQYSYSSTGTVNNMTGLQNGEVILIDQLKNKEMVFKGKVTYQESTGFSASLEYDRTFEKQ